jgi:multimeric flavodoxin WrbA
MKVIGICGSPRRGNTEWMLNQVMQEAARAGAEVRLSYEKNECKDVPGLPSCEEGGPNRPGICKIKDDMNSIYPDLLAADAIVLASPGYFEMLSGLLKNFIDRTCAVWPRLKGKRLAGLAVAEEGTGQTIQNFKVYARLCNMQWMGGLTVLAKNPHDAANIQGLDQRLKRLARKIVTP